MTNPAVARKTPDHANSPNGAVIFMTYCPDITECMYVISMIIIMHQRRGASPNFDNFTKLAFPPHPLSYTLLALSRKNATCR
uniref:Uncharacterized protein n=1 Tax=Arundo donax TaxID=35708 RepID=A0A0A9CL47_ARUDO